MKFDLRVVKLKKEEKASSPKLIEKFLIITF